MTLIARYLRAQDFTPAGSWAIADWCLVRGADEFSLQMMGIHGVPNPIAMAAERKLEPHRRPPAPRELASKYENESARPEVPLWTLSRNSIEVLKAILPGGLFTPPSYSDNGWIEDPAFYRRGEMFVGIVSHESDGFVHPQPEDMPSLMLSLPTHVRGA